MKRIFVLVVFTLFFCISSSAQNKIAIIDTESFYDKKNGITELVLATKQLEAEFKFVIDEIGLLNKKLNEIVIEIESGHSYRGTKKSASEIKKESEERQLKAQELSNKIKSIADEVKPKLEKRKSEIIEPTNKRIAEKLEVFKNNKGYLIIVDQSAINKGIINHVEDNITKEFIKFCNEEFEKEKARK